MIWVWPGIVQFDIGIDIAGQVFPGAHGHAAIVVDGHVEIVEAGRLADIDDDAQPARSGRTASALASCAA